MTVKDWKTSQKYIRIGHNKKIKEYFKTVPIRTARESLRNTLLIYKNDSASQMLVKIQYFQFYLSGVKTLTAPLIPDSWQPKLFRNKRPQLVVVYKPDDRKYPNPDSRWSLTIPHFNFTKRTLEKQLKAIPDYEKGRFQGVYRLTDNSKLVVYAKSEAKAKSFIKKIIKSKLVKDDYIANKATLDADIFTGASKGNYATVKVTPTYVKYYSTGQRDLQPDWASFID